MQVLMQAMFDAMDVNSDSILDAEELASFASMNDDHHAAYASLHVEEEGEYGVALPPGVTMHIISNGGHDDHGHGDDDGHDDDGHDDDGHDEELKYDPHSWLNPLAFKQQVSNVLDILVEKYPDMESKFTENANAYMAKLDSLHSDFDETFSNSSNCESNTVVANHNAYNYIGVKYNIDFVTIHGVDPEGEPSAEDIAEAVKEIKENGITVIFIEEFTDKNAVSSIVQETDVTVEYLYTMELPPSNSDDDYLSLMKKNLDNLKSGLVCSS